MRVKMGFMCTLVILRRPDHEWPLLIAGNRDEMAGRASSAPARHWRGQPSVIAGLDHEAGGSWLGLNDQGVVAVVMNRAGTLGRLSGKRSRGELVLTALESASADEAVGRLHELDPAAYRPFNLFVGDALAAHWVRAAEEDGRRMRIHNVPAGIHMLSAHELDDPAVARISTYLSRFRTARLPDPESGDWSEWITLLGERSYSEHDGPYAAMTLDFPNGFCTRSSHLIALPRPSSSIRPKFFYADGAPDRVPFLPIDAGV